MGLHMQSVFPVIIKNVYCLTLRLNRQDLSYTLSHYAVQLCNLAKQKKSNNTGPQLQIFI